MAVFRVDKTKDYTVMSNHHLRNTNLSMKAKGLLSLMLSLPDNWDYTLHGLSTISTDGLSSIRAAVAELESEGYLKRRRLRNERGQLAETEYTILEKPEPPPKSGELPMCENPILDKPILENPTLEKPMLGNRTQLNTNISNKEKSNTELLSINQSISHKSAPKVSKQAAVTSALDIDAIEVYRSIICDNIEYPLLIERYGSERIDEIVQLMLDAVCSQSETIRVDKSDCPAELVRRRLLKLGFIHIDYVISCLDETTTKIYNIRSYILTSLYNAPSTIDSYYRAAVNHDMYGDK